MTATEKLARAERWRIGTATGWHGVFVVPADGDLWAVVLAENGEWRHLAVTNFYRNHRASHNVIRTLRDHFFDDDAWVVQFWPPAGAVAGGSATTLHLWESIDEVMPIPIRTQSMLKHALVSSGDETDPTTPAESQAGKAEPSVPETSA